jgi:hypothetical protein
MITVRSKNQFGEEILVNTSKIAYIVPSLGGQESVIFFDNDTHINILESFADFKKRFAKKPLADLDVTRTALYNAAAVNVSNEYPENLPRLPNGNVDKRTNQYKDWVASKQDSVAHHPV